MIHAVDQKWLSAIAKIGRTEEMVTSREIRAVSWGGLFCISAILLTKNSMSILPQAMGNALISCIHAAHEKYESNAVNWQRVVEIGWLLLTRQDMERFKQMCENGLLGQSNYVIFEDWLVIDRSRDGYLRIKDGLVLEGEVQEMEDEERFFMMRSCTRSVFMHFSWPTTRCAPIISGFCSIQRTWSVITSLR